MVAKRPRPDVRRPRDTRRVPPGRGQTTRRRAAPGTDDTRTLHIVTFASAREHAAIEAGSGEASTYVALSEAVANLDRIGTEGMDQSSSVRAAVDSFASKVAALAHSSRRVFVAVSCDDGISFAPRFAHILVQRLRQLGVSHGIRITNTATV